MPALAAIMPHFAPSFSRDAPRPIASSPLSQTMALAELIVQSTQVLLADSETPRHFARLSHVVATVPSFRLEHTQKQLHAIALTLRDVRDNALSRDRRSARRHTFGDGAVLLTFKTKRYFSLNETGTRIWEMVQQTAEEEAIIHHIAERVRCGGALGALGSTPHPR